jgi:hypothetical protein
VRHRQAALVYAGLGILVIVITFAAGLVPASRRGVVWELAVGAVFVVIFAALIYRQPRVAVRWRDRHIVFEEWWLLSALLVVSNTWRAATYFNDARGWHVEVLPWSVTPIEPKPIAFVNAVLMAAIVAMLARSAWVGFTTWRMTRGRN